MNMQKLRAKGQYINPQLNLKLRAGDVLEVSEAEAAFLLRDAPGLFELVEPDPEPETAALDAPPADKMIKRSRRK